jgi:predicted regulator of amino acid metabolism with ACT domain
MTDADERKEEPEDVRGRIMREFEDSPGQRAVVELVLERGFSVNDEGRVVSGGIEIPYTEVAREAGVDRRVVDSTTETVLEDDELRDIFRNISSIPSLRDVAPVLGLSVLVISVEDAASTGVVAEISRVIADEGVSIRQAVTDDPYFTDEPRFTVITNGEVSGKLVKRVSELGFVEGVDLLSP